MKKACPSFVILLFCGCSVYTQPASPAAMIHAIFTCVKAKDENAFMALCPDARQWERIGKKFAENTRVKIKAERKAWQEQYKNHPHGSSASFAEADSALDAALRENYSPKGIKAAQERFRNGFRFMLQKGEKKGINWKAVTLINYTLDTANADRQAGRFFLGQSGYKSVQGLIHFKAGSDTFKMSFGDVLFLPEENGWYGAQLAQLVREGEPLEADHEGEETVEITLADSVEVQPPPPPPKAKGKPSSNRKKSKS